MIPRSPIRCFCGSLFSNLSCSLALAHTFIPFLLAYVVLDSCYLRRFLFCTLDSQVSGLENFNMFLTNRFFWLFGPLEDFPVFLINLQILAKPRGQPELLMNGQIVNLLTWSPAPLPPPIGLMELRFFVGFLLKTWCFSLNFYLLCFRMVPDGREYPFLQAGLANSFEKN